MADIPLPKPMTAIDEIKNRVDIVDLVSQDVTLRRSGKNYTGFCPFHTNTRTPAFVVFPDTGTWRCFSECNDGGDIFRYVMKKEGVDFREALKMLADRAGIQLEPLTPEKVEQDERATELQKLLEDTVTFYRSQLLQTEAGREAAKYLSEKRGITPQTAEVWGLGYAPDKWDAAAEYFSKKGVPQQDLIDAGLVVQREDGRTYDRFRHRVIFPIRDAYGKMAGFGGRVLRAEDVPKFLNSPQSILFDKSALLYGLDHARKPIRRDNLAVIVEGYLDVIVLHQEGFENTVSPMGTALTEAQMRQLKRFTRRFILALDPDAAGVKATLRGLEVARGTLDRSADVVFDARGLLHHEGRLQADLRVSALPDELDPDEIVLRDPEEWGRILKNAKPIIYHVLDTLTEGQDISDPKVKSEIAARILPLIQDVPDPVERDAYRQQIARVLQVSEDALLLFSKQRAGKSRSRRTKDTPPADAVTLQEADGIAQNRQKLMEQQVLGFLIRDPEQLYRVNRCLQKENLARVSALDMAFSDHQQVMELVLASLTQDALDPDKFVQDKLAEEAALYPDFKLDEGEKRDDNSAALADDPREVEEVVRLLIELRRADTNARINQLRFLHSEAVDDDPEARKISDPNRLVKLIQQRGLLDKALSKPIRVEK